MTPEIVIFLTGASVALSAVILGSYLNISRQSLLGDALSHSLLPGLVLAHLATGELDPTALFFGALLSGLATGYIIEFIGKRFRVREDIAMGITFTAAFSLGVLLLVRYASKSHLDTDCLLFGNLLFVPLEEGFFSGSLLEHVPQTLFQSGIISFLSGFFVIFLHRPFINLLFHENSFKLAGLPGNFLKSLFLTLVSLTIVFGFQAMGALLVFGLFVIPAGIGRVFSKSFLGICLTAFAAVLLSLLVSIKASFAYDLNPSAAWVSLLFAIFLVLFLISKIKTQKKKVAFSALIFSLTIPVAHANQETFEKLWSLPTLYSNPANPLVQEFKIIGRYHGQYYEAENHSAHSNDWEDRRARLGVESKLLNEKIEIKIEAQSSDSFSPLYNGLVDAYLRWNINQQLRVTAGKQRTQLGAYDFLVSSNRLPTFERSQIFNQLRVDRSTSVVAELNQDKWMFQAGAYSNDVDREFGQFGATYAYGAGLGYDFGSLYSLEKLLLRYDYLYSDIESTSNVLNRYTHLHSLTLWLEDNSWRFVTETFVGLRDELTVLGFYLLPSYEVISDTLEVVGRYSLSWSNNDGGVIPQSRYESSVGARRGKQYQAAYAGLQYFIHGDKLKLMTAIEYANLKGGQLDSWTYLLGSRFSF